MCSSLFRAGQPERAAPRSNHTALGSGGRARVAGCGAPGPAPLSQDLDRLFQKRMLHLLRENGHNAQPTLFRRPIPRIVCRVWEQPRKGVGDMYLTPGGVLPRPAARGTAQARARCPARRRRASVGPPPHPPPSRSPPRSVRRSPPPRRGGCPRSCLTRGPAASAFLAPADGPRRPTLGTGVSSVHVAVPEQVGAGSERRCGDRRGGQPRGQRRGPGGGRTGLRRAERCLLQFALQPRQLQPDPQRAERP